MKHADLSGTPELGLAAADHILGDANAKVMLVEYGDYACPLSAQAEPLVRHLIDTEGHRLQLVFRHFPQFEVHPNAELAAEAAEAAAAQGQFWPMHQLLFSHKHPLDLRHLVDCAKLLGLDMRRFHGDMADHLYTQRVQEHRRAGERSGVRATPCFFLNGKVIDVSFGLEKLTESVYAMLGQPRFQTKPN